MSDEIQTTSFLRLCLEHTETVNDGLKSKASLYNSNVVSSLKLVYSKQPIIGLTQELGARMPRGIAFETIKTIGMKFVR